jgi:ABC-2 type transport system ATP-binding protein
VVDYFAGFYSGIDVDIQAKKYLQLMGLWERRGDKVGSFSKGMKQRLALARALLHEPKVLLLDEPTAGLDPEVAREVRELIKQLKGEGLAIFLSTHNLAEAEQLCDRIAVIRTRLIVLEAPQDLHRRLFRRRVVVELEAVDSGIIQAVEGLEFVRSLERDHSRLVVELTEHRQKRPELVRRIVEAGGRVLEVIGERHSLEEVYLSLVREEKDE